MKFHLYGTSLSGIPVDEYAVTDSTGVATFSDILISGDTPIRWRKWRQQTGMWFRRLRT